MLLLHKEEKKYKKKGKKERKKLMLDKHSKTNTKNKTNKKIKSGFNFILGAQNFSMHNLLFAQLLKQFQKFPGAGSKCLCVHFLVQFWPHIRMLHQYCSLL